MTPSISTSLEALAPQRLRMSYEAYLENAPDSQIMEWVEGEVIIYMPPLYQHQLLITFLDRLLGSYVQFFNLGSLALAPYEVKLWPDGPSREPDLFFVANKGQARLTPARCEGAPDLIIEVISPSTVAEDRVHKFLEYERAGVREYWVIDPRPYQQQADFFVLSEGKVFHPAPLDDKGSFRSSIVPDFRFKIGWLWQEELLNPQLALAEIMMSNETLPAEVKQAYATIHRMLTKPPTRVVKLRDERQPEVVRVDQTVLRPIDSPEAIPEQMPKPPSSNKNE